jgi:hypothetical protein
MILLSIFLCIKYFGGLYYFFQAIITMINHAIGASGVVSQQCKAVVSQYGEVIMDLLLSEVILALYFRCLISETLADKNLM